MRTAIRKTVYLVRGMAVSLPFLACLADEHPEAIAVPPAPATPKSPERRGPRRRTPKAERPPTPACIGRDMAMKRMARGGA
jgi:hypothetical protein